MNKREAEIKSNELVSILAEERDRQDVSRSGIAKNLRMSTTTISKLEEFQQIPKMTTFILVADFLGYEIKISKKTSERRKAKSK